MPSAPDLPDIVQITIASSQALVTECSTASRSASANLLLTATIRSAQATYCYRRKTAEVCVYEAELDRRIRSQQSGRMTEADVRSQVRLDPKHQRLLDQQHQREQAKTIALGALQAVRVLVNARPALDTDQDLPS